jgi:hypothetical protein
MAIPARDPNKRESPAGQLKSVTIQEEG